MLSTNVVDLINMDAEDFEMNLQEKLENVDDYKEFKNKYLELIKKLDFKKQDEIDSCVILMTSIAQNAAYQEGFKHGIQFLLASMKQEI